MLFRLVLSAAMVCGLAAASDQSLQVLNPSAARSMQACTQLALQNAVNSARQKKLAQDNIMAGGINYAYVLGDDNAPSGAKIITKAKVSRQSDCAIPLTQERVSTGTRFELRKLPSNFRFDSITHSGMPVCGDTARAK